MFVVPRSAGASEQSSGTMPPAHMVKERARVRERERERKRERESITQCTRGERASVSKPCDIGMGVYTLTSHKSTPAATTLRDQIKRER